MTLPYEPRRDAIRITPGLIVLLIIDLLVFAGGLYGLWFLMSL